MISFAYRPLHQLSSLDINSEAIKKAEETTRFTMSFPSPSASNPSLTTSAYMVSSRDNYSDEDVASLPSESTSASDLETLSDDYSDAEEEWRESIEQLELLLTMVLVPFVGKYFGRKCAYWGTHPPFSLLGCSSINSDMDANRA